MMAMRILKMEIVDALKLENGNYAQVTRTLRGEEAAENSELISLAENIAAGLIPS
jgi:hypothetical protein